ncbi:MAG TPA: exopolysaccharide biosynthesis polyprenyl glycosylphosphotransferase [Solirubrobacterales bacterium]|nr:exopolysaccharide biosynthesis polyprenyl glycosylphosphotransferase [Solirubrobacterales bacterium]
MKTSPHLTALRAQRLLGVFAFGVAPAATAGLMAAGHLGDPGRGVIVFVAVLFASWALGNSRYPLHLMPLAAFAVRALVPVLGVSLALATFALAGSPESAGTMVAPVIGAWIVTAFATWSKLRFESSRQVRVAMIGSPALAVGLAHELQNASIRGYSVVGWLDDDRPTAEPGGGGPRRLGSLNQVREVVKRHSVDLLVHSSAPPGDGANPRHSRLELFERVAADCLDLPVRLIEASQLYEELLGHVPLGQSNSAWFQYLLHPRYRAGSPASKRAFDLLVGGAMLAVLTPVLAVFAAVVKLTDRGPVLYRQRRVGEGGREFEMIKLRSMRVCSEERGARWADAEDERVTAVGKVMRRLHIDEMPQLWNVLRGDMTIVGPRPERRELIAKLERQLTYYDRRHLVKPGLAGWAQARCGYGGSEEGTSWKLCHDLFYLKHRSLYFDSLILLENVRVSLQSGVQFGVQAPQEQFIFDRAGEARG